MSNNVFMIMPFGVNYCDTNYTTSIKPICARFNLNALRADELFTANPIVEDIVFAIKNSKFIIADVSKKNENVFYELGIAHALEKPTIIVTRNTFDKLPFDIKHIRAIKYNLTHTGKTEFDSTLEKTIENILGTKKEFFREEFDIVLSLSKRYNLSYILALRHSDIPVYANAPMSIESKNVNGHESWNSSITAYNGFEEVIQLDYAKIERNEIILTQKGELFCDYLESKGAQFVKYEPTMNR